MYRLSCETQWWDLCSFWSQSLQRDRIHLPQHRVHLRQSRLRQLRQQRLQLQQHRLLLQHHRLQLHAALLATPAAQTATPPAQTGTPATPTATPPEEVIKNGYVIHQTADLGGHIVDYSGSGPMWATLVNIQSGPRVLGETFEMHSVEGVKHSIFDTLLAATNGFGGDPNNVVSLRMSKGKLYDFRGLFRRDRQYFDYNLFSNPLIPSGLTSNGYTFPQVTSSPHAL